MDVATINIMGNDWRIILRSPNDDDALSDCDGYTDDTSRSIIVSNDLKRNHIGNTTELIRRIIRHEIVHAYMFESGLGHDFEHPKYEHEETMVDWIARQFPKMVETMRECDAL